MQVRKKRFGNYGDTWQVKCGFFLALVCSCVHGWQLSGFVTLKKKKKSHYDFQGK